MWQESKHLCSLLCSQIQTLALLSVSRCFMKIKSKSASKIGNDLSCMGRRKGGLKGCRILKGKKLRPAFSFPPVQTCTTGRDGDFRILLNANFKYWILIILWLHQKIPPAIYILPSLRKTMHLNSHRPTTRDSKVWKKNSFWHLAASGNRKNHGYHHHDQGYPRSPQW